MPLKLLFILLGGCLFLMSGAGYLCVKLFLRPKDDSLDAYHFEFEDRHPQLARYDYWSRIMFVGVIIGMLLLFAALAF